MALFNVNVNEWIKYGKTGAIHQKVITYIEQNPNNLFDPTRGLYPRGWDYVSRLVSNFSIDPDTFVSNIEKYKSYLYDAISDETEPFIQFLLKNEK